jgi:hypothetical protein
MHNKSHQPTPASDLAILITQVASTGILSGAMTAALFSQSMQLGEFWTFYGLYTGTLWTSLLGLTWIVNTVIRIGHWDSYLFPHFLLNLASILLVMVQQSILYPFPPPVHYLFISLALFFSALGLHETLAKVLHLPRPERISLAVLLGISIAAAIFWEYRNLTLQGLQEPSLRLARWVYLILAAYPLWVWIMHGLSVQQRGVATHRFWIRLWNQLARKHPERGALLLGHWLMTLLNFVLVQTMLVELAVDLAQNTSTDTKLLWACLSLHSIPCCLWAWKSWQSVSQIPRNVQSPSMLQRGKVSNFLKNYHSDQRETWLGLRTAVLMIDHDPHEECRSLLPSLLYRARQMQCEQIIKRTFSRQIFSLDSSGSQIMLAIDPEDSQACCTEALLILTVLYLDGLPLVERRLKHLVRLLPLLDPDLAKTLSEVQVESIFGRLQGFFHLDYNWVDQSMQSSEDQAQIEIKLESLNPRERQRVLAQLSSAQWLGNFIWISEAARNRLRMESPFLASAIERWPIQLDQTQGKSRETAAFLVKFENLIPRLQRYYALDELRSHLAPLPLSEPTQALVDRLSIQLNRTPDFSQIQKVMQALKEHDWNGFRAKDLALDLLLKAVQQAEQLHARLQLRAQDLTILRQEAKDLVQLIGYPSQELHDAHMRKLELRQVNELQRICLDPRHPRCIEAWLLLASLPTKKLGADGVTQLLELITTTCRTPALRRQDLILHKAVEALFQLAHGLNSRRDSEVLRVIETLAQTLIDVDANQELLIGFMDRKLALDQQRGQTLPLSATVMSRWKDTIRRILDDPSINPAIQSAIQLRWKSFGQSEGTAQQAS